MRFLKPFLSVTDIGFLSCLGITLVEDNYVEYSEGLVYLEPQKKAKGGLPRSGLVLQTGIIDMPK
jgi:hypothetical protein